MKKPWLWLMLPLGPLLLCGEPALPSGPKAQPELHRSPADVAVLPGGRLALTANQTADSVSLIDLVAGKVLAERLCGRKPIAIACSRDGRHAAVSNLWSGTLTLIDVQGSDIRSVGDVQVGYQPRGLVFAPDGNSLYVALAGDHEVVQVDWKTRKLLRHWPAPAEPRRLALTRDGRFLVVACGRSARVRCWDTRDGKQLWEQVLAESFNLHGLAFSVDDKHLVTAQVKDRQRSITKSNIENGWALDSRLGRLEQQANENTDIWQIGLDLRSRAVGDPCGVAFSPAGAWLAVTAAGTHELLLFQLAAVPWSGGEPQDFLDSSLDLGDGKFRRIELGGRPLAVQFADEGRAVVANYLLDAVQIVDTRTGKVATTIPLGGPTQPSLARRGEAIFYDAQRSHHQWFSCHTCHPDGHTSGRSFDTLNDDSFGNPKLTPSLRGVSRTGPWTWHGWQNDLGQAVEKSLIDTLYGRKPPADDVRALVAFLGTLEHPPNPHRRPDGSLSESAGRGRILFEGKGRCIRCHHGNDYTSPKTFDVKMEPDGSPYEEWNPPSLRGVIDRGPYLHDGRADTLDEVLRLYHGPEKLGGASLTAEERRDLVEFLNSL